MWTINLTAGSNQIVYGGKTTSPRDLTVVPAHHPIDVGISWNIWYFDNPTQRWLGFNPLAPDWASTLKEVVHGQSYDVIVSQDAVLSAPGAFPWGIVGWGAVGLGIVLVARKRSHGH